MLTAFFLACQDLFAPRQRRALLLSILLSLASLAALAAGIGWGIDAAHLAVASWVDRTLGILGGLAGVVLAWLLFPAMVTLIFGFFIDGVLAGIEAQHYPGLPPPRRTSLGETLSVTLSLAFLALVINLLLLPVYMQPGVNLIIYYGLNGYLLGRQYYAMVAVRRLDRRERRWLWHRCRFEMILSGAAMAFLLSLPLINLVAPLLSASLMLHLFEAQRRRHLGATVGA